MKRAACAPLHCAIVVQHGAAFERMGAAGRVANLTQINDKPHLSARWLAPLTKTVNLAHFVCAAEQ
jgi:hypothetical protein